MNYGAALLVFLIIAGCVSGRQVRMIPGDKEGPFNAAERAKYTRNICSYNAADSDMSNAGIDNQVSNYCNSQFGESPDAVHVNADSNPYKMCLIAGTTQFGSLSPVTAQKIVASDSFNNTSDQTVEHTFMLGGTYMTSLEISTTTSVELSTTVAYSVGVPDEFSGSFSLTTSFSSSKATSSSTTNMIQYSPSTQSPCNPHCFYSAQQEITTSIYSAPITVPLCLSGYARCEYNSRVQGHYYWYVYVDDFISESDRCFNQEGELAATVASVQSITTFSSECYLQNGNNYLGCYADISDGSYPRDLNGPSSNLPTDSPQVCINYCLSQGNGYKYAGLQFGVQCFCGNSYGNYGPSTECTMNCPIATDLLCGGPNANSIYPTGL